MALECFYTLPGSVEEHRILWRTEPRLCDRIHRLRQTIDPLAEFNQKTLEATIARSLFEMLRQHPEHELTRSHWIAFLQRRCEQVAGQILSFFPAHLRSAYFQDLFLMGCEVAIDPVKFYENFDTQRSQTGYWYPTLKKFSDIKIKHRLIPKLRKITGLETLGRTNLGLVARSSRKQVKEALQRAGYGEARLSEYLLIWQCFQEVRNSINLGINKFKPEHFQQIAERYREFRAELTLPVNGEEIKDLLENIGTAIRQLLDPALASLNTSVYHQSDEDILLENLADRQRLDEEKNQTVDELREFIDRVLQGLEEIAEKQTLFLRYGLELRQSQIGQELGGQPQYQICRSLQRLHNRIFSQICDWVRQNLGLEPNSNGLSEIEAVLCQYYADQIDCFFKLAVQLFRSQSLEVLKLFYLVKLSHREIGEKIHKSEAEVKELLEVMRQWLYSSMTEQIQAETQLQFQSQSAAEKRIDVITETRLETILQLYLTQVASYAGERQSHPLLLSPIEGEGL